MSLRTIQSTYIELYYISYTDNVDRKFWNKRRVEYEKQTFWFFDIIFIFNFWTTNCKSFFGSNT